VSPEFLALKKDCPRSGTVVPAEEQGPPGPGAIERTLREHAWKGRPALDAVAALLLLQLLAFS
jgi:hypothetical protein